VVTHYVVDVGVGIDQVGDLQGMLLDEGTQSLLLMLFITPGVNNSTHFCIVVDDVGIFF
jgi:hypothetical protein